VGPQTLVPDVNRPGQPYGRNQSAENHPQKTRRRGGTLIKKKDDNAGGEVYLEKQQKKERKRGDTEMKTHINRCRAKKISQEMLQGVWGGLIWGCGKNWCAFPVLKKKETNQPGMRQENRKALMGIPCRAKGPKDTSLAQG